MRGGCFVGAGGMQNEMGLLQQMHMHRAGAKASDVDMCSTCSRLMCGSTGGCSALGMSMRNIHSLLRPEGLRP